MEQNNQNKNDNKREEERKKRFRLNIIISLGALLFAFFLIFFLNSEIKKNTEQEISYTEFIQMLKDKKVEKVTFKSNLIYIEPKIDAGYKSFIVAYYTGYVNDTKLVEKLLDTYNVEFTAEIDSEGSGIVEFLLTYLLPILGLWVLLWFFMRSATKNGGMLGGVGKSNAKMYVEKKTGVTFEDVAGETAETVSQEGA